jgi:hypothetical protein
MRDQQKKVRERERVRKHKKDKRERELVKLSRTMDKR